MVADIPAIMVTAFTDEAQKASDEQMLIRLACLQ